ncbi:hypothetical protein [Spirillospora sp. NPDC029432]|uniref:hypothetical protein n=1 Tax=Spirillospora sp. NPDC029432 TaxID=3154599 RepID=UPI003451C306
MSVDQFDVIGRWHGSQRRGRRRPVISACGGAHIDEACELGEFGHRSSSAVGHIVADDVASLANSAALWQRVVAGACLGVVMDGEQVPAAVARLMQMDRDGLMCEEEGHSLGHVCLPVSGGVDGLAKVLTERYAGPFPWADGLGELPPRGRAWVWDARVVVLGQEVDGRAVVAVAERDLPDPGELPAEMPWVERLVAITAGTVPEVPAPDWAAVESRLGVPLPGDYKRLVETFGCDGLFDEFLRVFTPEELIWHTELYAGIVPGGEHPPPFPDPGGVIPWSDNENEERFFWITEGPDPDRWPVYALDSLNAGSRFECTAAEFLFRQMTDPDHPLTTTSDFRGHWFARTRR